MRSSDGCSDVCSSDLSPALHCAAARRQELSLHPAAHGSRFSARPEASRGAARQGALLRAVRERGVGEPDAQRAAKNLFAAKLYRQLFRSEEHTSELQSLMRLSYAVFCLKKKTRKYISDQRQ